ncbi:molybdate ABC transporter substrate-binding protein [Marinomonas sp. A79]|uniref:Molybdate ABC transporter substrate-binding protein n=1 Tax=Marinomonas vulgaris TaxID=2823372 RepID=A0ABS5H7G6_9GAMM|nr:molybdate ABC transporter substrate-binding protein [Marinomonas vulgaris]MBR7887385.1 molybdate ABC transporter substrate-binding protein [Marinomonas vulgaris]
MFTTSLRLIFCLITFSLPLKLLAADLSVAVASNFIVPIKQLAQEFEAETGHTLQLSFGSSGKFFAQIKNNAPYDLFLSADLIKPHVLIQEQLALPESLSIYANGKLVLWSVNPIEGNTLESALLKANRIAIANPKLAPYGKAAEEVLTRLSAWNDTQRKLVQGESIGQTYQFVYSQNANVGFVALSQVLSGKTKGHSVSVPTSLYNPIHQGAVILSRSKKIPEATEFMAFLLRPDIQAKIVTFGYAETK